MENLITDAGQTHISVQELGKKVRKLDGILHKINRRIDLREQELKKIIEAMSPAERKKLKEGLKLYHLEDNQGKEA